MKIRTWEEEHLSLSDVDIFELISFDYTKKHGPFVLIEPFLVCVICVNIIRYVV